MSIFRGVVLRDVPADLFFVTAYGPKLEDVVIDASSKWGPGAKQSFKDESDINLIMRKYQKSGAISWLARHEGDFADVSSFDFLDAQLTVAKAKEMFADLPSSVRSRFQNDPAEFLFFMSDSGNQEEAVKLGLAVRKEPTVTPKAAPTVVVPPVVPGKDPETK